MVEYIIIVVLIAITLIVLFAKFGNAIGSRVAGATEALDSEAGGESTFDGIKDQELKNFKKDGTFQ